MERILSSTSGRYKVLKLLQYLSRLILSLANHKRLTLTPSVRERLRLVIGQCSLQRRILQLGNLYKPLKYLLVVKEGEKTYALNWTLIASAICAIVEDASEDAFTLARLGLIPRRFTELAIYADRAWLVSCLLELRTWTFEKRKVMQRKRLDRLLDQRPASERVTGRSRDLVREEWFLDLDGLRIMCDFGHAVCGVFEIDGVDGIIVACAMSSSVLGLYRFLANP